jgi:anaerobic selenocysteine-containing dehydrogenase
MLNAPAVAPAGQARSNAAIFRALAARMGFADACFDDSDETMALGALNADAVNLHDLQRDGWAALRVADAPFADGGFPTPSGKAVACAPGLPLPDHVPNHECAQSAPLLAARYPLAMISPPSRHFLNSTFVNVASQRAAEREPRLEMHLQDAAARGIESGAVVRVFNDRGSYLCKAEVSERARPGVVNGMGIWWRKHGLADTNVNELTSQHLTDMGRGPTFYDCLVEVART